MYLCYVDESGHNGKKFNPSQPVQVLCGALIDATKIHKTQRELNLILHFLHKKGIPLSELKASDAYRGRKHWGAVKPAARQKLFELVLDWAHARSCKYIVCPIDTRKFFDKRAGGCPMSARLGYPYEAGALNVLMAIQRHQAGKRNNKGKTIVTFDEQHGHDENLIRILEGDLSFTDAYTRYVIRPRVRSPERRFNQIVDVPHFSKSHLSMLIQIADWAAFIVAQYLHLATYGFPEKYPGELMVLKAWYEMVGRDAITHTCVEPPGSDPTCTYYRELRPNGWVAREWPA